LTILSFVVAAGFSLLKFLMRGESKIPYGSTIKLRVAAESSRNSDRKIH